MGKGWIKVHRKITNNELWLSEPFTKGQAWIDLLLLADGIDSDGYEAGKVYKSVMYLADRWKWSRGKTRHFLKYLESQQMIQQKSQPFGHILTIENWAFYQGKEPTKKPTKKPTNLPYKRRIEEGKEKPDLETGSMEIDGDVYWDPMVLYERMKRNETDI